MSDMSVNGASNVFAGSIGNVAEKSGSLGDHSVTMDQPTARPAKHSNVFSKIKDFINDVKTSFKEWRAEVAEDKAAAKQEKADKTMTKSGRTLLHELTKPDANLFKISKALNSAQKAGGQDFISTLSAKLTELTAGRTNDLLEAFERANGGVSNEIDGAATRIEDNQYPTGMDFDMGEVRDHILLKGFGEMQAQLQELAASLPRNS